MFFLMALACAPETTIGAIEDTDVTTVTPSGVPDIFVVQEEGIDFGAIPQTGQGHKPLSIENRGGGLLNVKSITVRGSSSIFIDSNDDFILGEDETLSLQLIWDPGDEEEWDLTSTIEILCNDPDERVTEIPVEGEIEDGS
jgi:hypothetical protein